jgi:hypothetical protein
MVREPRDYDAELKALQDRARKLRGQKTMQLGELVQAVCADTLPLEALAGALLAAVETSKAQPDEVARWTGRGQAFFQGGETKQGKGAGPANAVSGDGR